MQMLFSYLLWLLCLVCINVADMHYSSASVSTNQNQRSWTTRQAINDVMVYLYISSSALSVSYTGEDETQKKD